MIQEQEQEQEQGPKSSTEATESESAVARLIALPRTIRAAAFERTTPAAFVAANIARLKASPTNPYGDDDEAIATAILRGIVFWELMIRLGVELPFRSQSASGPRAVRQ